MLTPSLKNKFRKFAEQGFGDRIFRDGVGHVWVVFSISKTYSIYVRQFGGGYDKVEISKC